MTFARNCNHLRGVHASSHLTARALQVETPCTRQHPRTVTSEREPYDRELGVVLEKAVLSLSDEQRLVFVLRDVEGNDYGTDRQVPRNVARECKSTASSGASRTAEATL
jgi:DNA-directed RNA polymerase specialized sigma24 family protein